MAKPLTPLPVTFIRELALDPAEHPHGQSHLSAASGLVRVRQRLYVVADDELHLGVFDDSAGPGTLVRLLEGELPRDKGQRKKAKPDLETLALPPSGLPHWRTAGTGPGSKPQRETGALVGLNVQGVPTAAWPAWTGATRRCASALTI